MTFQEKTQNAREEFKTQLKILGIQSKFVDAKEFQKIFDENYLKVFSQQTSNYVLNEIEKGNLILIRDQYFQIHFERIVFLDQQGNYIGHFLGESEEPSTFYLRNAGIVPDFRRKGLASEFLRLFIDYLKLLGYSRITSQHHGTNHPVLIMMLKQGFNIAGMELREEFGLLVKLNKHLIPEREELFRKMTLGPTRI